MEEENKINDNFFDNINGYKLDLNQRKIILDNHENILVVAEAGSGKTLTIVEKLMLATSVTAPKVEVPSAAGTTTALDKSCAVTVPVAPVTSALKDTK